MGESFDSKREMERYIFLLSMEKKGLIKELRRQVQYTLLPDEYTNVIKHLKTKDKLIKKRTFIGVRYRADFQYYHVAQKKTIIEDVKICAALIPKEYLLKEKMMHALKGIDIKRIYTATEPI